MSTVNNVRLNNMVVDPGFTTVFNWWWNLTRGMKKAGWNFKASSNGTTKISNSDPAADQFGAGTVSNAGAAAASITVVSNGRATVTGLTGIIATDKGRFILISGGATGANNNQHQIEEIISATSVRIDARNFAVAVDANNGALTWSIRDPLADLYSSFDTLRPTIAWWCAQGPSTLKIPITSASVGTFIRGENVVQTTTGAEGEFVGYVFSGSAGYLVILPRVRGSGTGVHGWQTSFTITGNNSAATVIHNGTAIDYVYEMVFVKTATAIPNHMFLGQFDTVADSAEMFSFCATQAGCTATVHPGGGGTGNAFGAHAWVAWGAGTTAGTGNGMTGNAPFQRNHIICVDAISESGYTADASFALITGGAPVGATSPGFALYAFQKLNDTEEGDLSTYVSLMPTNAVVSRTNSGAVVAGDTNWIQGASYSVSSWYRRGLSSEAFLILQFTYLYYPALAQSVLSFQALDNYKISTGTDPNARVREPIWLISNQFGFKFFKGTLKWLYWYAGDQSTEKYGSDPSWAQIGTNTATATAAVIGPADNTAWVLNA